MCSSGGGAEDNSFVFIHFTFSFQLGSLSIYHCIFTEGVLAFLGSDISCMSSHSSIVYKWSRDTEHTCCCSSFSFYSFLSGLTPFLSLSTSTTFSLSAAPVCSLCRVCIHVEKRVCRQRVERGKKAELLCTLMGCGETCLSARS